MRIQIILLFFFALPCALHAQVAGFYTTENDLSLKWAKLPVRICINKSVPKEYHKNIIEAAEAWNRNFDKKLIDVQCSSKNPLSDLDNVDDHSIFWVAKDFKRYTDKTSLARTLYAFDEKTADFIDSDVVINGETYNWKEVKIDLTTVLIHEMGHVLGLQHNFIFPQSVMNYYPYVGGYKKTNLESIDLLLIKKMYFDSKDNVPLYFKIFSKGDLEGAIKELLTREKTLDANELYALAMLFQKIHDLNSAIKYMSEYLKMVPNDFMALYKLGDLFWSKDNADEAIKNFKKSIEISPNYYEPYVSLGVIYLKKNMREDAILNLKNTLKIQPAHYLACSLLFDLLKDKKYQKCFKKYAPEK